jgi:hypothetical protein
MRQAEAPSGRPGCGCFSCEQHNKVQLKLLKRSNSQALESPPPVKSCPPNLEKIASRLKLLPIITLLGIKLLKINFTRKWITSGNVLALIEIQYRPISGSTNYE